MKRFPLLIALALTVLFTAQAVGADYFVTKSSRETGVILTDTIRWHGSGAVPGSVAVKIDTIVAGTLNDTTRSIDIAGAELVSVTWLSRGKNDDCDFTIYASVSAQSDTTGPWHQLSTAYSVDNTKGSQVGGSANTARDTTNWLMGPEPLQPGFIDTSAALALAAGNAAGVTWSEYGDRVQMKAARWLRFHIDPDASAGDTTFITGIITTVYPLK